MVKKKSQKKKTATKKTTKRVKRITMITIPQFAAIVGVSRTAVDKALKAGKIDFKWNGRIRILDKDKALKQWMERTSAVKRQATQKGLERKKNQTAHAPPEKPDDGVWTLQKAELKEKTFKAKSAELKYLEQAGKMIEAAQVEREAFEMARAVRDRILTVPLRVAPALAAETDPHKLEIQLTRELIKSLEGLSYGRKEEDGESETETEHPEGQEDGKTKKGAGKSGSQGKLFSPDN